MQLCIALKFNRTLTDLDVGNNRLRNSGICAIATALPINKTLVRLNLEQNPFGLRAAMALRDAICTLKPKVVDIDVSSCKGTEKVLACILGAYARVPSAVSRGRDYLEDRDIDDDFDEYEFSDREAECRIITLLTENPLQTLRPQILQIAFRARHSSLVSHSLEALSQPLHAVNLATLDLSGNTLGVEGCLVLANFVQHSACISRLDLAYCRLTADGENFTGLDILLNEVGKSKTVEAIDLSFNTLVRREVGLRDCKC